MNINGSGGLMLLVVAGLWLWVFIPSWLKRSEAKESKREFVGRIKREVKAAKRKPRKKSVAKQPTLSMKNYYLSMQDEASPQHQADSREWEPHRVPAQIVREGELEQPEIADV
ncbi:MAG: hypothetical protein RLZZ590_1116, partial [Actinomycetota bacterium]